MYVDTLMLVVGVSLFSITFSIIQWGTNKLLNELYWNLAEKKQEDQFNKDVFGNPLDDEEDIPCACGECERGRDAE